MFRRRTIELAAGAIAGLEFGPPDRALDAIFLHANGFNAMTYRHLLAPLADVMRILAVDLRGHGNSTLPIWDDARGWQVFADDLLALVAALGAPPPIIAGHSMGATAALLAAPSLPRASLVLFDPVVVAPAPHAAAGPDWQQPWAVAALRRNDLFADRDAAFASYRGRGGFTTWPDEMLADYLQDGLRPAPGGFTLACPRLWEAANFAGYCVVDAQARLAAFTGPVHVLRAENGSTCALDDPRVTLETVSGTTHFLPMERPDVVRQAILRQGKEALLF